MIYIEEDKSKKILIDENHNSSTPTNESTTEENINIERVSVEDEMLLNSLITQQSKYYFILNCESNHICIQW